MKKTDSNTIDKDQPPSRENTEGSTGDPSGADTAGLTQAEATGPETRTETREINESTSDPSPGQPSPADAVPVPAPPSAFGEAPLPVGKQPAPAPAGDKVLIADSRPVEDKKGHTRAGGPGKP